MGSPARAPRLPLLGQMSFGERERRKVRLRKRKSGWRSWEASEDGEEDVVLCRMSLGKQGKGIEMQEFVFIATPFRWWLDCMSKKSCPEAGESYFCRPRDMKIKLSKKPHRF